MRHIAFKASGLPWGGCFQDFQSFGKRAVTCRILETDALTMNSLPPTELLDEMHSFPGKFTFKAIGLTNDDFALRVIAVVRSTLNQDFDAPYELRETSGRRHVAVTVEPWVESSQQVIEVFTAIRNVEGLVMLM